jgi:hypothetical protein
VEATLGVYKKDISWKMKNTSCFLEITLRSGYKLKLSQCSVLRKRLTHCCKYFRDNLFIINCLIIWQRWPTFYPTLWLKRDYFNFVIINFPHLDSNILTASLYFTFHTLRSSLTNAFRIFTTSWYSEYWIIKSRFF